MPSSVTEGSIITGVACRRFPPLREGGLRARLVKNSHEWRGDTTDITSMSEIFVLLNLLGTLASVGTFLAALWLCVIVKKGLDDHVSTIQLIYEEIRNANGMARPSTAPPRSSEF